MRLTLSEIAARLGAELRGADGQVDGVRPLDLAGPADLSLCADLRHSADLDLTRAGAVLLPRRLERLAATAPCPVLLVEDWRLALAEVLQLLYPQPRPQPGVSRTAVLEAGARVHETAQVDSGAVVGAGAEVGAGCWIGAGAVIGAGVSLGRDCRIGYRAVLEPGCRLGDRVVVGAGAVVGSPGFGVVPSQPLPVRIPQVGGVVIADDVEIGANCTIDRGTLGDTVIGRGCKLDKQVHVGHNTVLGEGVIIAAQSGLSGSCRIEAGALLGGQVGVADHAHIGAGAQVGAKSGVAGRIPDGARVAGIPAVAVERWLSGLRRLWRRQRPPRRDQEP